MQKTMRIKQFIANRISQIDSEYEESDDCMRKLNLSTMRTSFANILNVYLSEEGELGVSYLKHAQTYIKANCYDQAIYYAQLAKKSLRDSDLLEEAIIINLNCLLKLGKADQANDLLKDIVPEKRKQQFYEIKAEIMEKMKEEEQTFEVMSQLREIIEEKYTGKSMEMGLYLIELGKKKGSFNHYEEALKLMQQGMNLLIEVKYKNHLNISKVYLEMATLNRELKNLDSEYSSLICAHSMMRQVPNNEKQQLDILHKIVNNLFERDDFEGCMKQLLKIEELEKHIYGESSLIVGKTIKKISDILTKMNKKVEAKKYEQQFSRIISCNDRKGMSREKPLKYSQIKVQA